MQEWQTTISFGLEEAAVEVVEEVVAVDAWEEEEKDLLLLRAAAAAAQDRGQTMPFLLQVLPHLVLQ